MLLFRASTLLGHLYVATTIRRSESINLPGVAVRSHKISGSTIGRQSRGETAVGVSAWAILQKLTIEWMRTI